MGPESGGVRRLQRVRRLGEDLDARDARLDGRHAPSSRRDLSRRRLRQMKNKRGGLGPPLVVGYAPRCSSAYFLSSSVCCGVSTFLRPRRYDTAMFGCPRSRRCTTLSRMVCATSAAGDRRSVDVGDVGLVLGQQVLLDQVVHHRHDGGVGDRALLPERLVHVAHRRPVLLPDDGQDVGLERPDASERGALRASQPLRLGLLHDRITFSLGETPPSRREEGYVLCS